MKRTLAITASAAMLALSLAGCGAERNGGADSLPDFDGTNGGFGTTATDTMRNDGGTTGTGTTGTGTTGGATANANTANNGANTADTGLGGVTGAVNRAYGRYGVTQSGRAAKDVPDSAWNTDASWNPGAAADVRYRRMLENGRVHDTDGFLFDGENASYRTF